MKRSFAAGFAVGVLAVYGAALSARRRDVTADRASASRTVTVRRGAAELYTMWTSPEELPRFLRGVSSVEAREDGRQRWVFEALGVPAHLDVEIIDARPAQRVEWRASRKGPFEVQGAVTFNPAPAERGTEVRFSLALTGPAAGAVTSFARLFGASPPQIAMESLRSFKALAETGEIPKAVRD